MSRLRPLVAAAAAAAVTSLAIGVPAAHAATHHQTRWYWVGEHGGLASVSDNNVGPFQVCHNNVPVNAVGGQVPVTDVVGLLGIGSNGNTATLIDTCGQQSAQNNHATRGHTRWYRVGDNGGLVNVSDNNVGPFQVCHNNVPVNAVGGQVPVTDVVGLLGIGSNGNHSVLVKTCQQATQQNNTAPTPSHPAPTTSSPTPSTPGTASPTPSTSSPGSTPPSTATTTPSPAPGSSSPSASGAAPSPTPVHTTLPVTG